MRHASLHTTVATALLALGLTVACAEEIQLGDRGPSTIPEPGPSDDEGRDGVSVSTDDQAATDLFGDPIDFEEPPDVIPPDDPVEPPEPAPLPTRPLRRLDIDQLNAAIRQVTGGIGWTEVRNGREVDLFEELSGTLGRPDFLDTTFETLEPSPLFQKFLGDAARQVCTNLVVAELAAEPADRVLMHDVAPDATPADDPEGVEANLRYLLLRYHGRSVAAGGPELEPWRWLFESAVHVTEQPEVAWRTVCVGLITHPSFYTY